MRITRGEKKSTKLIIQQSTYNLSQAEGEKKKKKRRWRSEEQGKEKMINVQGITSNILFDARFFFWDSGHTENVAEKNRDSSL